MNRELGFLIAEGAYRRAQFFNPNSGDDAGIKELDTIRLINPDGTNEDCCATSVRIVIVGREKPGGPLGERYGIVCAENDRKRTKYTLGGGRVEPSVNLNRTSEDMPSEESVLQCLRREVIEELEIDIDPRGVTDNGSTPDGLLLIGLRYVTEEEGDAIKMLGGRKCVDACFLMIHEELLGYSRGFKGETGVRAVLHPNDLFARTERGELKPLPQPQVLALAMAIIFAAEIFSEGERPEALRQLISDGLGKAKFIRETSRWTRYFTPTIQY